MPTQLMYPELPGPEGDAPEKPSGPSPIHWGLLVLGAAKRRKVLAGAMFLMGLVALVAYYKLKTPLYRVEASILVQKTPVASSSPEDPARSANVLVHRRENLIDLIKQTNLLVEAGAAPSTGEARPLPLNRAATADSDLLNVLVLRLDRALEVTTGFDGTISIRLDWPDPQQAYRLVEAAQQNFLEARHVQEITAIDEVISILQGRTATLQEQLTRVIDEVQHGVAQDSATSDPDSSKRLGATRSDGAAIRTKNEELVTLKSMLDAKQRAISDVEEFRRHRLAELQAQLDEKRGIYSDAYPSVVSLRQDIEALSRESPQIAGLREEARKLRQEYAARLEGGHAESAIVIPSGTRPVRTMDNSAIEQNERVREARGRYLAMLERLNSVQLDLDTARAAFKHRYNVTWPAEVPKKPVSPKPEKILGLGTIAVLLVALFGAAAPDLWSGRIVQRWQVERSLNLPVLAELKCK